MQYIYKSDYLSKAMPPHPPGLNSSKMEELIFLKLSRKLWAETSHGTFLATKNLPEKITWN